MKKGLLGFVIIFSLSALVAVFVNSCKKERPDTDTQSSVDNSICEGEFTLMFSQTNSIAVNDSGVQKWGIPVPMSGCPDAHIDTLDDQNGFPKTLIMAYGSDADGDSIFETGCTSSDGKTRRGIVRATFSEHWTKNGTTVSHTFDNYYVNGIKFEGTVTLTRNGNSFTQTVVGGKCTKGSEWTILWDCSRTLTYLVGDSTNVNDDICLISGSASGTDRNGRAFSVEIDPSSPLKRTICPYIVQGIQTIKIDGKKDRTINYGDGTCDNIAVLTIDGNEFEFQLQ